jgi:heterodisulfide reductase subunit B
MKLCYYPGCTLKNKAKNFEEATKQALATLDIELDELKRWNCCGTVFSFTSDNVMYHLAPIRDLLRVQEAGYDQVLTLCSMCFNTLKRSNKLFNDNQTKGEKMVGVMENETSKYEGKVKVAHLLEVLRDIVGVETLKDKANGKLKGLKLAPYYGCMLLRPDGIGIDDVENPSIFETIIASLGAEPVEFALRTECCGSYQTVETPEVVAERTYAIVSAAQEAGADALVVSCPLCAFNLDQRQALARKQHTELQSLPVLYIGEVLAMALGIEIKDEWKKLHEIGIGAIEEKLKQVQADVSS